MVKREYMTKVDGKINVGKKHQAQIPSLLNMTTDSYTSSKHMSSEHKHTRRRLHANENYATTKTAVNYKSNNIKKGPKGKNQAKNNNSSIKNISNTKNASNPRNRNNAKNTKKTEKRNSAKIKLSPKNEQTNEYDISADSFSNSIDFTSYGPESDEGVDVFHEGLADYLENEYKEDTDEEQIQNFLLVESKPTKK